jgi:hypothetical protein
MKILKIVCLALAVAFMVIQFIRPEENLNNQFPPNGIRQRFAVPESVQAILRRSCYDCHSNNTVYPWYANVEPVGWWLNSHIRNGKRHVNYDEYGTYRPIRQFVRFRDLIEQIKKDDMPLRSFALIHQYARLTPTEKDLLIRWSTAMMDTMKANYPADSLRRRPGNDVRSSQQGAVRGQKDVNRQ